MVEMETKKTNNDNDLETSISDNSLEGTTFTFNEEEPRPMNPEPPRNNDKLI